MNHALVVGSHAWKRYGVGFRVEEKSLNQPTRFHLPRFSPKEPIMKSLLCRTTIVATCMTALVAFEVESHAAMLSSLGILGPA